MKRINPKTNQPFKYGDVRDDGYVFVDFRRTRPIKKDGTYQENWLSANKFKARNNWNNDNSAKWKSNNRERALKNSANHAKNNPAQYAAKTAKRRTAKLQRTPNWLTEHDLTVIQAYYSIAAMLTRENGIQYHVDHIIPLQGRKVSGLHTPSNLQVIPAQENAKKSNKHSV